MKRVLVWSCLCAIAVQASGQGVNLCYPGESIQLELPVQSSQACDVVVFDWLDRTVLKRPYDTSAQGKVSLSAEDVGTFGAFRVEVVERGTTNAPLAKTWFARLSSKNVEPVKWIGTHAHLHRKCYADGRYLDIMTAAGLGYVRYDYSWHGVEVSKGQYQAPAFYDECLRRLEERGIGMVVLLALYQVPQGYDSPKDLSGFPAFCAFAVKHLKGHNCIYEIYNEPQNTAYRRLFKEEEAATKKLWDCWLYPMMDTAKKAAKAMHEVDPNARIYITGEDVEVLLTKMIASGVATENEGISFHPYGHKNPYPERVYWFRDGGAEIRALAKANGGATKFCITECGIPTLLAEGHRHHATAGDFVCTTAAHQAAYITRLYLMSRLTGVDFTCQYNWMNEGTDIHYTEHNFGQLFNDCTPKPSFAATAQLARLLGKAKVVGEKSPDPLQWRLAEFVREEKDGNRKVFAVWSIEKDLEVEYPEEFKGAAYLDLMGNKIEAPLTKDGKLKVGTAPYYVVEATRLAD